MRLPDYLTRFSGPSSSSSSSESYDYSGFDDHIKRQDAIGALRDNKFSAMYGGDVMGAVSSGNKIRDLLKSVRANTPNATERDPVQLATPLVRVSSTSRNASADGANFEGNSHRMEPLDIPPQQEAPQVADGKLPPDFQRQLIRARNEGKRPER